MSELDTEKTMMARDLQPYEAPVLRLLGDVRQLTLGGSTGTGDSGNPGAQQF